MPRQLPDNWRTLNVSADLRIRGSYPQDLRIWKRGVSPNLYASYLPSVEDDPREHQGRTKQGKGKRKWVDASMGTDDPWEAAKRAIAWVQEKQRFLREQKDEQEGKFNIALDHYWDVYFEKESRVRENQRNFKRWRREELLKWEAEEYGIAHQGWAKIRCDLINRSDFKDYFDLLETRARKTIGSNGSGMKGQQKTLINKLLALAEEDFPGHAFPSFPKISKQTKQVRHLTHEEWRLLLQTVFELGEGKESVTWTPDEYKKLDWSYNNRQNIRNWVDLYDALNLEWFFYLRAEDMYRLRSEWFKKTKDGWICDLETTKKDRPLHRTIPFRKDAEKFLKRIISRKPKGYLVFPHMDRPKENEADSGVLGNINFLLKKAIEQCLPDFPSDERKWTTIRHTAFRLTLEDDPSLGVPPKINAFADNGHTSPQQLRDTYLRFIDLEKTAMEAREKIEPSQEVRWGGKYKSKKDVEEAGKD